MIYGDIFYILMEFILCLICYFLAGYAEKVISSKWRLVYVLPVVACLVALAVNGFEISLMGAYIGSLVMLVGFWDESKKKRCISVVAAAVLTVVSIPVCMLNKGYRSPDYLKEFKTGFETMKEHYCLTEHKGIDWDELYEEYYPQFKEADKNHDDVANYIAWAHFTSEFYDGHVAYVTNDKTIEKATAQMYGNDYGLSLMRLADGRVVAVNVEPDSEASRSGIKNGTEIVDWDGESPDALVAEFDQPYLVNVPVAENEDFYKPVYAAGKGGDTVDITFVDDEGLYKTVTLEKLGYYSERIADTLDIISAGRNESNLSVTRLNADTACLRLSQMIYDSKTGQSGDYSGMYEELKTKLEEQKNAGVTNLVIDIRNNGGGDPNFILTVIRLLAPDKEFGYAYSGVWDDKNNEFMYDEEAGHYVVGEGTVFEGEDMWGDGQIILLVNANTVSAGDHFTALMSELDNVTIMGFTPTNCSGQAIRGVVFSDGVLSFSTVPTLNEDGTIYIDTSSDRIATTPLDVRIPFDEYAVDAIFNKGEDYIMSYALDYIDSQTQ